MFLSNGVNRGNGRGVHHGRIGLLEVFRLALLEVTRVSGVRNLRHKRHGHLPSQQLDEINLLEEGVRAYLRRELQAARGQSTSNKGEQVS